jgi:hypothetical protein
LTLGLRRLIYFFRGVALPLALKDPTRKQLRVVSRDAKRAWTIATTGHVQCEENGTRQVMDAAAADAAQIGAALKFRQQESSEQ